MSRIGKQPIVVPSGVEVKLDSTGRNIDIKGAKGNLTFHWRPEIEVTHCDDDKQICCAIAKDADEIILSSSTPSLSITTSLTLSKVDIFISLF